MRNQTFVLMDTNEKERKLCAILRNRTNDALTHKQVTYILQSISPELQYEIGVFTEPTAFCEALMLDQSGESSEQGKIVFGQALFGRIQETGACPGQLYREQEPAVAIITRFFDNTPEESLRSILIYIPPHLYVKGVGEDERQRVQTQACL